MNIGVLSKETERSRNFEARGLKERGERRTRRDLKTRDKRGVRIEAKGGREGAKEKIVTSRDTQKRQFLPR